MQPPQPVGKTWMPLPESPNWFILRVFGRMISEMGKWGFGDRRAVSYRC